MADLSNLGLGTDNPFLGSGNPYLQQQIDATSGDLVRNYNLTTQPAFNSAMVNSGSFGNAGVQQMNDEAQRQLQQSLGRVSNDARSQDYQQQQAMYQWQKGFDRSGQQWNDGFNRDIYNDAYSQNMNNLQTGIGLLGTLNGYGQQDITNAGVQQNTPLNYWSQFANQANGIGQGYGTSTQSTPYTSSPLTTALGGAQLGNAAMSSWRNSGNTNSGSNAPPAGYANWGAYNYGMGGGGSDNLSAAGNMNGWWGTGG